MRKPEEPEDWMITGGTPDPDCPLCRAMAESEGVFGEPIVTSCGMTAMPVLDPEEVLRLIREAEGPPPADPPERN